MWLVLTYIEHGVFLLFLTILLKVWTESDPQRLWNFVHQFFSVLPGAKNVINVFVKKEVKSFVRQVTHSSGLPSSTPNIMLPKTGIPHDELRKEMKSLRNSESLLDNGKVFAYVYTLPDDHFELQKECFSIFGETSNYSDEHDLLVKEFHQAFLHENALNPMVFPSLRRFELEILSMTSGMLNGDSKVCGFLTSGGTESLMMAIKTYRDRARKMFPHITKPEIVAPITAHPCIDKAAHYFDLTVIHTETSKEHTADVAAMKKSLVFEYDCPPSKCMWSLSGRRLCVMSFNVGGLMHLQSPHGPLAEEDLVPMAWKENHDDWGLSSVAAFTAFSAVVSLWTSSTTSTVEAINANTILLVGSAPQFCHGIVDPIAEMSSLAVQMGLPLHVDACFGGFMLPWVEKLGYPVPVFDFRLPGVTSISADIHKYGYGAKGSSVILYRDEDIRRYQIYSYSNWPGGLYGSPSMAGTRPGGNIAASWAAMKALGEEGYLSKAEQLMTTTEKLKKGITKISGLNIIGQPHMTAFAVESSDSNLDILNVAELMEVKGWVMERLYNPSGLHFTILPHHIGVADDLLTDLADSVAIAKINKKDKKNSAALYGMMASITDRTIVDDFIVEFFSQIYQSNGQK